MRIPCAIKDALGVTAAAFILASCSSGGSPLAPAGSTGMPDAAASQTLRHVPVAAAVNPDVIASPNRSKSWMDPSAKAGALLYISDFNNNSVYVYSWPKLKAVGTLTGFTNPQGLCTDKAQNVWISNTGGANLEEFAHGGTTPIATLSDAGFLPVSCSINPMNGDLAVGNIDSSDIVIYKKSAGNGKTHSDPNHSSIFYLGYDNKGTLFIDGFGGSSGFALSSFKKNAFTKISVTGATINFPGGVQYGDGSLTVGDQTGSSNYSVIYQLSETGVVSGSTNLTQATACVQYFIYEKSVVCPNAGGQNVEIYKYPAGGSATKTISGPFSEPIGSVISK